MRRDAPGARRRAARPTDPCCMVDIDGVHLAVRRAAGTPRRAGGLVPLDRRHTPLPFGHGRRSPARASPSAFELVWASGWEEKADEHLPHLLGLPPALPFLRFERAAGRANAHWKLDAIDAYAGARPLAWIDDALNAACHEWARRARGADAARADRARARAHAGGRRQLLAGVGAGRWRAALTAPRRARAAASETAAPGDARPRRRDTARAARSCARRAPRQLTGSRPCARGVGDAPRASVRSLDELAPAGDAARLDHDRRARRAACRRAAPACPTSVGGAVRRRRRVGGAPAAASRRGGAQAAGRAAQRQRERRAHRAAGEAPRRARGSRAARRRARRRGSRSSRRRGGRRSAAAARARRRGSGCRRRRRGSPARSRALRRARRAATSFHASRRFERAARGRGDRACR